MSAPQSPFFSYRASYRLAGSHQQSPLLSNSQRAQTIAQVDQYACDELNFLDAERCPALSASANYRSLKAHTNELLSPGDGSEDLRHVRELEQFYINSLRDELERNRVNNFTLQQKRDIYERAKRRFQRLVVETSLKAKQMTEELPEVLRQFQRVFDERQRYRQENYENVQQRHAQLEQQMQKTIDEAYNSVRNSTELREQLIRSHFERWQAQALSRGEALSQKYDAVEQRVRQLQNEREKLARDSTVRTETRQREIEERKRIVDAEYAEQTQYLRHRYEELTYKTFHGRSEFFDELVSEKRRVNEGKRERKLRKEQKEVEEIEYKAKVHEQRFERSAKHIADVESKKMQFVRVKSELLDQQIERARQVLGYQAEQRVEKREQLEQKDIQTQLRRVEEERQVYKQTARQSDIEHHKQLFIGESCSTGLPELPAERLPTTLRAMVPQTSILNMPRDYAMRKIAEYEDKRVSEYTPAALSEKLRSSTSEQKVRSSHNTPESRHVQQIRKAYIPKNTVPASPLGSTEQKRRNTEAMLGIVEQERQREIERSNELAAANEANKPQIEDKHMQEREETEEQLRKLQEEYEQERPE